MDPRTGEHGRMPTTVGDHIRVTNEYHLDSFGAVLSFGCPIGWQTHGFHVPFLVFNFFVAGAARAFEVAWGHFETPPGDRRSGGQGCMPAVLDGCEGLNEGFPPELEEKNPLL